MCVRERERESVCVRERAREIAVFKKRWKSQFATDIESTKK